MAFLKRLFTSLFHIAVGVPIVSLAAFGVLFVVFGETLAGRSVGLSLATVGGILYCTVGYWSRPWFKRNRRRFYATTVSAAVLFYLVPMLLAPNGGKPDGRVRNCFLHDQGTFYRYSPWNVLPESDQFKVGTYLLSLGEVDYAEAARLRSVVLPVYREMDRDPDFHAVGSAMGLGYRELARLEFRTGHYFVFLPETSAGERVPCLVFLHGIGGNMKACLGVLSKLSRQMKCAVVAPTFGFGNWDKLDGAKFVVEVAHEAVATLPINHDQVFLMGYSNGALGVTRAAMAEPGLFRGFIYLSPVTENEFFSTDAFDAATKDRKILFLHGGRDKGISKSFVTGTAAYLRAHGCDVELKVYDDEDHYLLFLQQEAVLSDIAGFMRSAIDAPTAPDIN